MSITCARGPLAAPVFSSAVGALAMRADFPIDRIQDSLLLIDAVVAACDEMVAGGRVTITADTTDGCIRLRIGPLLAGGTQSLLGQTDLGGVGDVIRRITSEAAVRTGAGGAEFLLLAITASDREPRPTVEDPRGSTGDDAPRLRRV